MTEEKNEVQLVSDRYAELMRMVAQDTNGVAVTGCCEIGNGKSILRINGVWYILIYAGGMDGKIDILCNGPIQFCANCGAKLDEQTELLPYGWGMNGQLDDMIQRIGGIRPQFAVPFKIVKSEENGKGDEVQENEDG